LFLFAKVLGKDLKVDAVRAKTPQRLPTVLSKEEVVDILSHIPGGAKRLLICLFYGSGLRLMEACRLRVNDFDFDRRQLVIREGKGDKDRYVPLPEVLIVGRLVGGTVCPVGGTVCPVAPFVRPVFEKLLLEKSGVPDAIEIFS
jgi:integrase